MIFSTVAYAAKMAHCRLEVLTAVLLPNPLDTFAAVDSFISGRQKGRTMS